MSLQTLSSEARQRVAGAGRLLLARLPEDRSTRLALAAGSLSVAGVVLLPLLHYAVLGRQVRHTYPNASARGASRDCGEMCSLAPELVEKPGEYRVVHDKVTKAMPELTLGLGDDDAGAHFTQLLRYHMTLFSHTPQAWVGWFAVGDAARRKTFTKAHIDRLDFREGDVVNGLYEVVKRTPLRAEIAVRPPPAYPALSGLLVIGLHPRNQGAVLQTETIQWARKDAGVTLPLESSLIAFLHALAERYIAVKGAAYLQSISQHEGVSADAATGT